MSALVGYVEAGLNLGLQSILVRPQRSIGQMTAQVTIRETHTDELEITDHPIEVGSVISDHAFMRPCELVVECGWSNSPTDYGILSGLLAPVLGTVQSLASLIAGGGVSQVKAVYDQFLAMQSQRVPFSVQTGKRIYDNMLVKSLRVVTDKTSENSLMVTAVLRQVILVSTQVVSVGAAQADQANPSSTTPTVQQGNVSLNSTSPTYNAAAGDAASTGSATPFAVTNSTVVGTNLPALLQ